MARPADPAVRPALLEAAAAVLATEGLGALSVRRLAAEVGASTQAVYTHFDGKDDLVVAVVREAFARLAAELDGVGQTDDPLADLAAMGDAYRRNALANRHLYRVMFGLNPLALSDPAVELDPDALVELDQEVACGPPIGLEAFATLVRAVARAVDAGRLVGDPAEVATTFWATAHGAVSLELAGFLGEHGGATFDAALAAVSVAHLAPAH